MRFSLPLAAVLLTLLPAPGRAQLIFLKDGFVINGKVRKETVTVADTLSGESYNYTSCYHVDDGPRRFYFSQAQMQRIDEAIVAAIAYDMVVAGEPEDDLAVICTDKRVWG